MLKFRKNEQINRNQQIGNSYRQIITNQHISKRQLTNRQKSTNQQKSAQGCEGALSNDVGRPSRDVALFSSRRPPKLRQFFFASK
jgi:hypothetical protein